MNVPSTSALFRRAVKLCLVTATIAAFGDANAWADSSVPVHTIALIHPELEGDLSDASRLTEWADRLDSLEQALRDSLSGSGIYGVADNSAAADLIARDGKRLGVHRCRPCLKERAERLGADRVLAVWVVRMSQLVLFMQVELTDPLSGRVILSRNLSFRGDNDRSWHRTTDYLVRELQELPSNER